ncbi:hypothetical protein BD560DRAFT_61833 [Blakeslea trispora]|nr:hypothetical protein BD560DRAFT_61833 [Blakeslea trispora]
MSQHNAIIKAYFGSTEDNALSFEGFIRCHFLHIRNSLGSDCSTEFGKWFGMYCEQAKLHDIKIIRGQAKKAWNELVIPKTPTSKKRSYFVANVGEEVEVLKKKLAFEDGDDEMMLKKFNDFRTACIDEFKQAKQTRSMHCDLDKLLAIQGILRLGKKTSPPVAAAFGEESVASFWKKMKKEKFGEVKSMTESTRKQLEDALEVRHHFFFLYFCLDMIS